jgi:PAS domain S-box-containing protein
MKMKFTIGKKIGLGFGGLVFAVLVSSVLTYSTLLKSIRINDKTANIYTPSVNTLQDFKIMIIDSKTLIGNWISTQSNDITPEKNKLRKIHDIKYKELKGDLSKISVKWDKVDLVMLQAIILSTDSLFAEQKTVMSSLNSFESYEDPLIVMEIKPMMDEGGSIVLQTERIINKLDVIISKYQKNVLQGDKDMFNSFKWFKSFVIIMGLFLLVGGIIIAFFSIRTITVPVRKLKEALLMMGKGKLPKERIISGTDEIGEMSDALNGLIDGLKDTANFANQIGNGNLATEYTPMSKEDVLGNSLLEMRKSLKNAAGEEQNRKAEDEKRNWTTHGLAKFAEILRQNNDDIKELSFNIIRYLVNYLKINQGGMFILNDDDKKDTFLELSACYAYDRKKYLEKRIEIGEGLVGACFLEKKTIHLTDVPDDYIHITSGLGYDNPRSILIVPLKLNDQLFGVIELASFEDFRDFEIDFVEKVGESIASTISSVKINVKTAYLLEQSQIQTEAMKAQEEEMRQNLEELTATQEEMAKKNRDIQGIISAIDSAVATFEVDMNGRIIAANKLLLDLFDATLTEMKSLRLADLFTPDFLNSIQYQDLWETIRKGKIFSGEFEHPYKKGLVWSKDSYAPIIDIHGDPYKILCFVNDVSDQKMMCSLGDDKEKHIAEAPKEEKKKNYDYELDDE